MGLMKTVICLESAQIPPQMHLEKPNPAIDLTHRTIATKTLGWPDTSSRVHRAAVNTFGAGGTNGHAVLEAYENSYESLELSDDRRSWLFKLSAADEVSLRALVKSYFAYIQRRRPNLRDLAHTLIARRSNLKYSRFLVASNHETLCAQLQADDAKVLSSPSNPVKKTLFVFTGQGAQW